MTSGFSADELDKKAKEKGALGDGDDAREKKPRPPDRDAAEAATGNEGLLHNPIAPACGGEG